jgi:tmRNA-binding protein
MGKIVNYYVQFLININVESARYKNLPLLKEQIKKLKENDMCTLKDLIFYWKERFWIFKFFWLLGKKIKPFVRIMVRTSSRIYTKLRI